MRSRNKHQKITIPAITLRSTYTSYFVFNGQVCPVAVSSSEVFRDAVSAHAGDEWDNVACKLLEAPDIDLVARWYVLNRLADKNIPMKLYTSRFEAEMAIKSHAASIS